MPASEALARCGTRDVDFAQMSELRSVKHDSIVRCACATGANRVAVGCADGSILLHDLGTANDESASKLLGHGQAVSCLCLLSEEVLASGSMDNTIRIWNLRSKEALQVLSGHTDYVRGLAQLSDTQLASASDDKTIRLWNFAKPEDDGRVLQGHSDYVRCLCRSTAGSLVSGSRDTTLRVWNPDTGEELRELRGHRQRWCHPPLPGLSRAPGQTPPCASGTSPAGRPCGSSKASVAVSARCACWHPTTLQLPTQRADSSSGQCRAARRSTTSRVPTAKRSQL